jgi:mono/diheme cytochrome c family protein
MPALATWSRRSGIGVFVSILLGWTAGAAAQERPAGVTDTAVSRGQQLYVGKGNCANCHGAAGEGTEEGVPLTSGKWELGDGSYAWLQKVIRHSGIGARGRDGDPMPMRGPTLLSPEEIADVAAYVWTISRKRVAP